MPDQPEQSLRTLVATNPEAGKFIAQVLLTAHDVLGYGKEMEIPVARALVHVCYSHGIVGEVITKLIEYAEQDPAKAYDVLAKRELMAAFKESLESTDA